MLQLLFCVALKLSQLVSAVATALGQCLFFRRLRPVFLEAPASSNTQRAADPFKCKAGPTLSEQ